MDTTYLIQQLETGHFVDVIIKVGNKHFAAHRLILSWKSNFFRIMFTSSANFKESVDTTITLDNEDEDIFGAVLHFVYGAGYQTPKTANNLAFHASMFRAADYYQIEGLGDLARSRFYAEMEDWEVSEELIEVIEMMYSDIPEAYHDLKDMVVDIAARHFDTFLNFPKFKSAIDDIGAFSRDVNHAQSKMITDLKARFGGRTFYCRKCAKDVPIFNPQPLDCRVCHRAPMVAPSE
ncbi:BTB/POZ protein [Phyllosticta capitalensis]